MSSDLDNDLRALRPGSPPWRRVAGRFPSRGRLVRRVPEDALVERAPGRTVAVRDRTYRRLLAVGDVSAALVALIAVSGGAGLRVTALLMPVLLLVTYKILGLYDRDDGVMRRSTLAEVPRLGEMAGLFALLTWLFADQFLVAELTRGNVVELWLWVLAGTVLGRAAARALARRLTTTERLGIVGDGASIDRVRAKIETSRVNAEVVETFCTSEAGRPLPLPNVLAFIDWLNRHRVERLVIAPDGHDRTENLDFVRIAKAAGVRVSLLPRMFEAVGSSVEFEDVDGMTVLGLRSLGLSRSSRLLKRGFDVLGSGLGVVVAAPLLALIAVAVKLSSRGPIFFRQPRVGRDGRHFHILKFRSMVDGADAMKHDLRHRNETEGLFKIADDPRVTVVGRALRKTSLDELPQLLNVLRGEMSLVGPRPLVSEEDSQISGLDRARLHLTPGITGPWQILGPTRVPLREMVSIDYLYVANWSLWRDVEILIRTGAHVLRRGGM